MQRFDPGSPAPVAPSAARHLPRRALSVLLSALALVAAVGAGAGVFLLVLRLGLIPAVVAGALVVFAIAWAFTALAHRMWRSPAEGPRRGLVRRRSPFIVSGALVVAVGIVAGATVLAPVPDGPSVEAGRPAPRFWDLSTGSRVAYWRFDARGGSGDRTPIVFVHGGPGAYAVGEMFDFLEGLRALGRDVWIYDQPGAGLSPDLKVSDYTTARWVADLEAFRHRMGSPTVDLIGHSAGGYIVEAYTAAHPDRVGRVALICPGGYDPSPRAAAAAAREWEALSRRAPADYRAARAASPRFGSLPLRVAVAADLFRSGDRVGAENLVDQEESRRAMYRAFLPINLWANLALDQDFGRTWPSTLRGLAAADVPTLYLRADHDYLTWAEQRPYLLANREVTTVYLEDATHSPWDDQPRSTIRALRAFFDGEPQPGGEYRGSENPVLAGAVGVHD